MISIQSKPLGTFESFKKVLRFYIFKVYLYSTTMSKGKNAKQPIIPDSDVQSEDSVVLIQQKSTKKNQLQVKKVLKNQTNAKSQQEQGTLSVSKKLQKVIKTQFGAVKKAAPKKAKQLSSQDQEQSQLNQNNKTKIAKQIPVLSLKKNNLQQSSSQSSQSEQVAAKKPKVNKLTMKLNTSVHKVVSNQPLQAESSEQSSEKVILDKSAAKKYLSLKKKKQQSEQSQPQQKQKKTKAKKLVAEKAKASEESESQQKLQKVGTKKLITKVQSSLQSKQKPAKKEVKTKKIVEKIEQSQDQAEKQQQIFNSKILQKIESPKEQVESQIDEEGEFQICVKGLSFYAQQTDVKDLFNPFGNILSLKLLKKEDGKSRGLAFVKFSSKASFNKALQIDGSEHFGRTLKVQQSIKKQNQNDAGFTNKNKAIGSQQNVEVLTSTLFVGGLSFSSTKESISEYFSKAGTVSNVKIVTDKQTGKPRGFGYVQFKDLQTAKRAYQTLNNGVLDGRKVRLDNAVQRQRPQGTFGNLAKNQKNFEIFLNQNEKSKKKGSFATFQGKLVAL